MKSTVFVMNVKAFFNFERIKKWETVFSNSQNLECARDVSFTVHCGSIRQTASILTMSKEHLRTGDKASVHFRFLKNPEFLKVGTKFVFREGRTKAVGTITQVSL